MKDVDHDIRTKTAREALLSGMEECGLQSEVEKVGLPALRGCAIGGKRWQ